MRNNRRTRFGCLIAAVMCVGVLAGGCGGPTVSGRYDAAQVREALAGPDKPGLHMGEFELAAKDPIIDGDTIRVQGLRSTLRLLAIDTEETFKKDEERQRFAKGWDSYLQWHKERARGPVKIASPLGEDAKAFAKKFFKGVTTVKLERDHPKEIKGRFDRFLTYVFVKRDGKWVNYNVECVRAGMTPYFTKYSYSRRFHKEFVAAQDEARAAGVGIWKPGGMHYDDYPTRIAWWNGRGDFIRAFEEEARGHDNYIVLTNWDGLARIRQLKGKKVVILATVGGVRQGRSGPARVMLSRRRNGDFPLIFFDKKLVDKSRIGVARGEYIRVRGTVTEYFRKDDKGGKGRKGSKKGQPQVVVNKAEQVILPTDNPLLNERIAKLNPAPVPSPAPAPVPAPVPTAGDKP